MKTSRTTRKFNVKFSQKYFSTAKDICLAKNFFENGAQIFSAGSTSNFAALRRVNLRGRNDRFKNFLLRNIAETICVAEAAAALEAWLAGKRAGDGAMLGAARPRPPG